MPVIEVNLNIIPIGMPPMIHLSQYDRGILQLVFHLFDGLQKYEIPTNANVTFRGTKPDRTGFEYPCTFMENTVTFDLQDQVTTCSGNYRAEIKISVGEDHITSAYVNMHIKRAALSEDTKLSETELPMMEKAVEAYDRAMEAQTKAEKAQQDAKDSAASAKNSADQAEKANSDTHATIANKQDLLTAGEGISLEKNVVAVKPASSEELGGVKIGAGLSVDENGVLNAEGQGSGGDLGLSIENEMLVVAYEEEE